MRRLPRLSRFAVEHVLVLPLGALIALAWANTAAESYVRVTFPMTFLVNDVGMVVFFGLITKEVVEATAPGGCFIRGGGRCCRSSRRSVQRASPR